MLRALTLAVVVIVLGIAAPAATASVNLKVVNDSNQSVWVTLVGTGSASIPLGVPTALSSLPGGIITVDTLTSARLYVAYGDTITGQNLPFTDPTAPRFDWVEFNWTPSPGDVVNTTAVSQFSIPLRVDTLDANNNIMGTLSAANADKIFAALQTIPGGPQATIRDSSNNILRVLSPYQPGTNYPQLTDYVEGLAGQQVTLTGTVGIGTTPYYYSYTGTFPSQAGGSITLTGGTPGQNSPAQPSYTFSTSQIVQDLYPDNISYNSDVFEGRLYEDMLAGFAFGYWGGTYGNNDSTWCTNPNTNDGVTYCPQFNQAPFGAARSSLLSYPACEQYAAQIDAYDDAYQFPYSDTGTWKPVTLDINAASTIKVTVLSDTGDSEPIKAANPNCGAQPSASTKAAVRGLDVPSALTTSSGGTVRVAKASCGPLCGTLSVTATGGGRLLGVGYATIRDRARSLKLQLNDAGRRLAARDGGVRAKLTFALMPPDSGTATATQSVTLHA